MSRCINCKIEFDGVGVCPACQANYPALASRNEEREALMNAIRRFRGMGDDYERIMDWLRKGAWMSKTATTFDTVTTPEFAKQFPGAQSNPDRFAAYIDGRKSMVNMLEEDIKN